ncbi:MAG TPA: GNAT family protein [Polyangia bacterium]|nr:GNAT family protein [Polyangia bacterium]
MNESAPSAAGLWAVEWRGDDGLTAFEPTSAEIADASADLATYYNDRHNRAMLGQDGQPFTAASVTRYYQSFRAQGGRPFLLRLSGAGASALVGDGDLRNIRGRAAEVAILIGDRAVQGRGLGTRCVTMLHAFAFEVLGLERLYISVLSTNPVSRRLFEKLGHQIDDSPAARKLIDDEGDLTLSVARAEFERRAAASLVHIRVFERAPPTFG